VFAAPSAFGGSAWCLFWPTLYICGDYRDTSSIQGALVSGERAAAAVLADLGVRRRR
jgi:predicted NAD/FAD-dependent oxidoreductase